MASFISIKKYIVKKIDKNVEYIIHIPTLKNMYIYKNTYKEACEVVKLLHTIRHDIIHAKSAYGLGWTDHTPAVILEYNNKVVLIYEQLKRKEFQKRFDAWKFLSMDCNYGKPDIHRPLTFNNSMSGNKKSYSVTDWLLKK